LQKGRRFIEDWKSLFLVVTIVGSASGLFLWQARRIAGEPGFPLDDAWIHARFADNLVRGYGFSYNRGIPSSGSTSPLWVLLLAAAYSLGIAPIPAGLMLGILFLMASCWTTYRLALAVGQSPFASITAAVLTALMARLIWGALSGMEVSLYVYLTLLALIWHVRYNLNSGLCSYLSTIALALAALARPECYVLFPIAWLDRVLTSKHRPTRTMIAFLPHLILYALILAPNWAFNISVTGSILPATFHAKVRGGLLEALRTGDIRLLLEALTIRPLDFIRQYIVFWIENNAALLIPACWGLVSFTRCRRRTGSMIIPLVFVILPLAIGVFSGWGELVARYIANLIPLYGIMAATGIEGMARWIHGSRFPTLSVRFAKAAILLLALLNTGTVGVYASIKYGWMVENINGMQIFMGHWVAENIEPDALIAINDVGALTYFGNREIIDTVGLTTPDIIPYLKRPGYTKDERILYYLEEHRPEYLIIFPNWYPRLAERADLFEPVYTHRYTGGCNVTLGGNIMVVYRCHWLQE
jgi:arabinofuranosyltransferase